MTLSKGEPRGDEARNGGGSAAEEEAADATPYRGSRCCVGFFQCHVCGHEWSSVFSWANTGQLCKPCSSKRRQTWVLPFRQIPKSRKYEFFCIDCDQYVAESYRSRDAHQGIACKACQGVVFPDWEFPCDACNVVHLYSFSKTDAMRGIDCECGVLLFPKHMKSLNRKHESRYCQKCQELGVNCCNFKARPSVEKDVAAAASKTSSATAKKPAKKSSRPRKDQRTSVSSVDAASGAEMKSPGPKKSAPRRKPKVSVSSVEGEASSNKVSGPKKSAPRRKPKPSVSSVDEGADKENASSGRKPGQRRKKQASASSVEDEVVEKTAVNRKSGQRSKKHVSISEGEEAPKKPAARRAKPQPRVSVSSADGGASADERTEKKGPRRRAAPKGRKQLEQAVEGEGIVAESDIRVTKSSPRGRGGRGGVRGGGALRGRGGALKQRVHVYGEDDVLRHARTPKNSVATDPGIRESKKPRPQRRSKTDRGDATISGGADAEVDALADQVAESVIISAKRVIVEENNNNVIVVKEDVVDKAPRQQKDENDNSIILERKEEAKVVGTEDAVVGGETVVDTPSPTKSKTAATAGVELKGGHPPAIKVGGRRRVSSLRKSESEGKKIENQESEDGAAEEAVSKEVIEADPENSQVQVVVKSRSVNHSEMTSVPEKPSPTKEVNRMPKVHPHHPTNKHPIQQPRK